MNAKVKSARVRSRLRRRMRIRKKLSGTPVRPRLAVYRSVKHTYAQVIDDASGVTLASASTLSAELKDQLGEDKKADSARRVGELVAKKCLEKGIDSVVFDRGGFPYHGRVLSVASGARDAGLTF